LGGPRVRVHEQKNFQKKVRLGPCEHYFPRENAADRTQTGKTVFETSTTADSRAGNEDSVPLPKGERKESVSANPKTNLIRPNFPSKVKFFICAHEKGRSAEPAKKSEKRKGLQQPEPHCQPDVRSLCRPHKKKP